MSGQQINISVNVIATQRHANLNELNWNLSFVSPTTDKTCSRLFTSFIDFDHKDFVFLGVSGAAAALPEAAGSAAAAAAGGFWTGATAAAQRERTEPGGQTEAGPGPQGPGGAEAPQ